MMILAAMRVVHTPSPVSGGSLTLNPCVRTPVGVLWFFFFCSRRMTVRVEAVAEEVVEEEDEEGKEAF